MRLPIGSVDRRVLNGIATVQHHAITDINAHMGNAGSVVCAGKEDKITGLCIRSGNGSTDIVKPLRTEPCLPDKGCFFWAKLIPCGICETPAGVRGFISFHFPRKRKISQWPKVIISHPKDISLHIPSFLLYNHFKKLEFVKVKYRWIKVELL